MRLLAFLLIITKNFLIFGLADSLNETNSFNQDSLSVLAIDKQDSIVNSYNEHKKVIRAEEQDDSFEGSSLFYGQNKHQREQVETDDPFHLSSQLDDNVVSVINKVKSNNKTNPLIELTLKEREQNSPAPSIESNRAYKQRYNANKNLRPLFSDENHEGKSRLRHKNHWCHRDCDINAHDQDRSICASDGRLYGSMCELRRHSCRHNIHLFKRPKVYCPQINKNGSEEVRIVELKRRCNRLELDEMKLLLLSRFNGDLSSMFKYFDSNGDHFIEAHELWPKKETESNKLMYAQVWDDHSNKCQSHSLGHRYRLIEDQSKCWYFLDFAFEPQFVANPCSLSHLMLFDLKHPNNKFNLDTFGLAFQDLKIEANNGTYKFGRDLKPIINKLTWLNIGLSESTTLSCLQNLPGQDLIEDNIVEDELNNGDDVDETKCLWTRYNSNLAAIKDPHIFIEKRIVPMKYNKMMHDPKLHIKDAQLYLSGQFKCTCHFKRIARNFEHVYTVKVSAEPRVEVRPHFQWSLPNSRISFECHYDYIDASYGETSNNLRQISGDKLSHSNETEEDLEKKGQFGLKVDWLKNNSKELIVDRKKFNEFNINNGVGENDTIAYISGDLSFYSPVNSNNSNNHDDEKQKSVPSKPKLSQSSLRASITMASSRLTLENLLLADTGYHRCRVEVLENHDYYNRSQPLKSTILYGEDHGTLLVQDRPKADQYGDENLAESHLWMFHDNGISIYRLQNDDGQEMELLREINGRSLISGEVDGNWNQLTLCGGLNSEQVVICEWSDNALYIDVKHSDKSTLKKFIYVGQPNLNRIIVMDGLQFEIVAIINTEPQPRKLHLYKPSKVHLSKWVRRRLSPAANARWLSAIGTLAHSLKSTPDSRLYSTKPLPKQERSVKNYVRETRFSSSTNQLPSTLIQHDIWLLCYGQPLIVDPSGDEHLDDPNDFYSTFGDTSDSSNNNNNSNSTNSSHKRSSRSIVQPFTPRLSATPQFAWSVWPNKESKLRNRKSVHIIQSTFFPQFLAEDAHNHEEEITSYEGGGGLRPEQKNNTVVSNFKRSTVLTTHHIFPGISNTKAQRFMAPAQFDLIQDLEVPPKPYSLEKNDKHKIHYAYVTHYDERRLFRVSMDEYRYDREIDLESCDPINLMTTAQGLLVIQCRAPITHNLIGQLVLDELTGSRIEFNANIRAQESYLSPDNRYLVSIYTNSTTVTPNNTSSSTGSDHHVKRKRSTINRNQDKRRQSIIFVQLVTVSGLKLQYEIKTSLEISQCSFVWKDGYYAAIFVSTNRRDEQSEILSLRLVDSRLELMARVPGLISVARHKDQLIVSPEIRLAALSTNQGTYVVDLEDNRVSQSLRHHQSPPTLLWV